MKLSRLFMTDQKILVTHEKSLIFFLFPVKGNLPSSNRNKWKRVRFYFFPKDCFIRRHKYILNNYF